MSQQYITVDLGSDGLHSTLALSRLREEYPIQEFTINTINSTIPDDDGVLNFSRLLSPHNRETLEKAEQTLLKRLKGIKVHTCRILYQDCEEADPAHFPTSDLVNQIPSEISLQVMSTGEDDMLSLFLVTLPESGQTVSYAGGLGQNTGLLVDIEGIVSDGASSFPNSRAGKILAQYLRDKKETETRFERCKREVREETERRAREQAEREYLFAQEELPQSFTAPTVEELLHQEDFRPRQFRTLQEPRPGETLVPLRSTDYEAVVTGDRSGLAWLGRAGEHGSLVRINPEGTLMQLAWRSADGGLVHDVRLDEEAEERLFAQRLDLDGFGDLSLAEESDLMSAFRASSAVLPYVSSEGDLDELADQEWDTRSQVSLDVWGMSSVADPADFGEELPRWDAS